MTRWKAFLSVLTWPFATWGRAFATFGIVVGIAGPIFGEYLSNNPAGLSRYMIARDIGLLTVLVLLILILAYGNATKDVLHRKRQAELRAKVEDHAHRHGVLRLALATQLGHANDMMQKTTQELFHHNDYRKIYLAKSNIEATDAEFEVFKKICRSVTSHVRDALILHFHTLNIDIAHDISVSVKLILPMKTIRGIYSNPLPQVGQASRRNDLWVITAYRDFITYEKNKFSGVREIRNALYTIGGNTAFNHIVDGADRFVHNDLKNLHDNGLYKNEAPDWNLQYNSTLVVPMVLKDSAKTPQEESRHLGFLAVDSKNPEHRSLYNSEECFNIMNHAALTLSMYFMMLILYHDK